MLFFVLLAHFSVIRIHRGGEGEMWFGVCSYFIFDIKKSAETYCKLNFFLICTVFKSEYNLYNNDTRHNSKHNYNWIKIKQNAINNIKSVGCKCQ